MFTRFQNFANNLNRFFQSACDVLHRGSCSRSYMRLPCPTDARLKPLSVITFNAAAAVRAAVRRAVIHQPCAGTPFPETLDSAAFVRKSQLPANGSSAHQSVLPVRCSVLRVLPVTAVISAASRHMMMPSLSVDHGVPSKRRNSALSSPPKPKLPSNRPSTNHLKPTDFYQFTPKSLTTRSIIADETSVLPTATALPHCGRCWNR